MKVANLPHFFSTLFALFFVSSLSGCKEPAPTLLQFPVDRTLHDIKGRPLEARLMYQTKSVVHIIRTSDGLETDIELANLSQEDRDFLKNYLVLALAPASPPPPAKPPSSYVAFRLERIEALKAEIDELEFTPLNSNASVAQRRKWQHDIREKKQTIERLEAEIESFKALQKKRAEG